MHTEITQAADFLGRLLQSKVDDNMIKAFKEALADCLKRRFANHWDPQQPYRGNGFRAISNFNGQLDPVLAIAAQNASVPPELIHVHLPRDFVLWIDPLSVSYRVGDHGNIMTLFEDRGRVTLEKSPHLSFLQPRKSSAPIRISPPSSPDNTRKLYKAHVPSPLAKNPALVQEHPSSPPTPPSPAQQQQQQPQQQQPQPQPQQQQQQLVLAN